MPADDAVAWVGTILTPLVLIAEYRLRRDLLVGRWLSLIDPPRQWPCWFSHRFLLSGLPPLICPKRKKSVDSMVLRNQQTDALNFVKLFYEKSPLLQGNSSYKRDLHLILSPENRKRGVQITSDASQTALTSMLKTVKSGCGKPRKGLMPRGFHRMASKPVCSLAPRRSRCAR